MRRSTRVFLTLLASCTAVPAAYAERGAFCPSTMATGTSVRVARGDTRDETLWRVVSQQQVRGDCDVALQSSQGRARLLISATTLRLSQSGPSAQDFVCAWRKRAKAAPREDAIGATCWPTDGME